MEKPKYARRFRGYLLDCHSPDPPVVTLERLEPKNYIETYKAANIDSIIVYAKGHWGECYYDTKVGHKHPGLKCDFLKEIVELGHRNDMEVAAYYSLGFDNWAAIKNPDWALKNPDGTANRACLNPQKWYNMCANSPYRDYALAQLAEIAGGYGVDGFFIDIFPLDLIYGICYCQYCERMAMSMWGKKVAELSWNEWVQWIVRQRTVLWEEIRDAVKRFLPEAYVINNGSYIGEIVEREEYVYAEGSTVFFTLQARGRGKKYCQMGPGNLSPIYDPRSLDACKLDISSILAYGGRPMVYSEAQHADGTLEQSFFDILGAVYAEVKEKQEYVEDAEPEKCVGVLYGDSTLFYYARKDYNEKFYKSCQGVVNASLSLHYPVDILYEKSLRADELDSFDVLVLPDVLCLDDTQAGVIREYVRKGGKLLASFKTSLHDGFSNPRPNFSLADVFGVDYLLDDATYAGNPFGSYLRCGEHEITAEFKGMTLGMPGPFLKVKSTSGQSIGWHTLPVTAQTSDRFVNWGPLPPGMETEFPVIHLNSFGEGKVVYVTASVFRFVTEGLGWAKKLAVNSLRWLLPEPKICVEGPAYVEATFSRQKELGRIVVHLLNRSVNVFGSEAQPAGARLRLRKDWFQARQVREVWPEKKKLDMELYGKYIEVAIPPVGIHTIVTVES